jgi:hypothetical protein
MVDVFRKFQLDEPGTHVSQVGVQMENIMRHGKVSFFFCFVHWFVLNLGSKPYLRYFVGYDSMASIVVGILPTPIKQLLIRNTLFRK